MVPSIPPKYGFSRCHWRLDPLNTGIDTSFEVNAPRCYRLDLLNTGMDTSFGVNAPRCYRKIVMFLLSFLRAFWQREGQKERGVWCLFTTA